MNELVYKGANDQVLTNSLLVAEKFEKEHQHVLRDIRVLIKGMSKIGDTPLFEETTYVNPQNKQEYPMFIMNRDGFTLLAMGFTGKKALGFKMDFINAFNKMESMLKSDDYILMRSQQILQKRVDNLQAEKKRLETELEEARPAVTFTSAVSGAESSCLVGELAKIIAQNGYAIGEKRLFKWMRDNGYLGKHVERYNVPNQQYIEQGLFTVKKGVRSGSGGVLHTTLTPKITGKGQVYFVNKFLGGSCEGGIKYPSIEEIENLKVSIPSII